MVTQIDMFESPELKAEFQEWVKKNPMFNGECRNYREQFLHEVKGMDLESIRIRNPVPQCLVEQNVILRKSDVGDPKFIVRVQDPERWKVLDENEQEVYKALRRKKQVLEEYSLVVTKKINDGKYEVKES